MQKRRLERLAALVRNALSEILLREIADPRLEGILLTRVRLTSDGKIADIYWLAGSEPDKVEKAREGLKAAASFLRRELAQRAELRNAPLLRFHWDDSYDSAVRVSALIESLGHPSGGNETESNHEHGKVED